MEINKSEAHSWKYDHQKLRKNIRSEFRRQLGAKADPVPKALDDGALIGSEPLDAEAVELSGMPFPLPGIPVAPESRPSGR